MLCRRWVAVLLVSLGPLLFASACDTAQEQTATAEYVEAPVANTEPLPEALDWLASLSGVLIPANVDAQSASPRPIELVATSPHQWTGIGVTAKGRIYVNSAPVDRDRRRLERPYLRQLSALVGRRADLGRVPA